MEKFSFSSILWVSSLAFAWGAVFASDTDTGNVQLKPISMITTIDMGQIVSGHNDQPYNDATTHEIVGSFLQREGIQISQQTSVGDRFSFTTGMGGVLLYTLPEGVPGENGAYLHSTKFAPTVQADALYKFGDAESPDATLEMGIFPYKYNPDAKNLGEYLLRSGTYPGIVATGGINIINSANYIVEGARLNVPLWDGKFQSDFLLPMEHDLPPMYDISPTYVGTVTPIKGLEIGAGVTWNHGIAINPSKTSPKDNGSGTDPGNAYIIPNPNASDSTPAYIRDTTGYYTFQGIKTMGRVSLAPFEVLNFASSDLTDFKLYAEVAVLGWKDYPFFYSDRFQRMPIMFGVNLPTFNLLSSLSFEMSYYDSKFTNNTYEVYTYQLPVPNWADSTGLNSGYNNLSTYDPNLPAFKNNRWKWSVYASRTISKGIRVYAQAASDYMVPYYVDVVGGRLLPFSSPVTNRNGKDWYFLFRLEFGI